jgi:hypothetical protein
MGNFARYNSKVQRVDAIGSDYSDFTIYSIYLFEVFVIVIQHTFDNIKQTLLNWKDMFGS